MNYPWTFKCVKDYMSENIEIPLQVTYLNVGFLGKVADAQVSYFM